MKFIYSLLAALCISSVSFGQMVALNPTGDGGFESGGWSGWSVVNPTSASNNWWVVGSAAAPMIGTNCAYISNTSGASWTYNTAVSKTAHFYRDIAIPTGASNINLYFLWKGFGEAGNDQIFVSTAPASVIPAMNVPLPPSTTITGATLVWTQPSFATGSFTLASVPLPVSLAGTTVRIIFSWQTNGSLGVNPPGAIDSVALLYDCATPSPITGNGPVCVGSTLTLADASPSGAWSSSDPTVASISSAGVVSGLIQGTTTISYTTVCLAPSTAVISVNAVPAAISGPTVMCLAGSITLGETSTGGTWTSSNGSIASVDPVTGVVTGNALGTARITYDNSCGTAATKLVTVSTVPPSIVGPGYVCEGGATISISNPIHVGTWQSDVDAIATVTGTGAGMATVTGVSANTVTISYFPDTTCPTSTVITVNPLPAPISGIVPICVGNTMTLTNSAGGGLWYSSVTGVATIDPFTGVVSGILGGTTTISYTNACGTGTSTITINPLPAPITGYDSVCVGSHTTLADATIGGTWVSFNPAVASVVSGAGSGLLTGVADGTTVVSYIMPGGCYETTLVTAFVLPSAISGLTSLCFGNTTTLSNAVTGGTWTSANPALASITSTGLVTAGLTTSSDTVGMLYTTPYGCTAYGVVTVNPNPLPILGDSAICADEKDTLTDLSPGGAWSSLTSTRATIDATGIMTGVSGGTATMKYTLPTGCFITREFIIHALPVPIVTFNPAVNTFYATAGFASYQWYNSVGIITGATTDHTAGAVNGYYYVTVTDDIGCVGSSSHVSYNISMAVPGVVTAADVKIFPNPATDMVYIKAPVDVRAVVSSIDGRELLRQDNAGKIDISRLSPGLYVISVFGDNGSLLKMQKLTKE